MPPRSLRRTGSPSALPLAALALIVPLALSACTPGAAVSTPRPESSGTAAPTATAAPTSLTLDCGALVSPRDLTTLLGPAVAPSEDHEPVTDIEAARGPLALPAAGGNACTWTAGTASLKVRILPHATKAWAVLSGEHGSTPGAPYEGGESRGGDCDFTTSSFCQTNVLVAEAWLAVEVSAGAGAGFTEQVFHDIVQRMLPVTANAVAGAPLLPAMKDIGCEDADLLAHMKSALGLQSVTNGGVEVMFRIDDAPLFIDRLSICQFQSDDVEGLGHLGSVSVLHGAADEYAVERSAVLAANPTASGATIKVKDHAVSALVWSASGGVTEGVADALVGDTWVQFRGNGEDPQACADVVEWVANHLAVTG
jgi:hypothetical protein